MRKNSRPMPPEEKRIHDDFIREIDRSASDRKSAARKAIRRAWEFYEGGDPKTAMKRFNQAWLLDPNDAEVFLGFASLMSEKGQTEESIRFNRKALSLNPRYEMAMTNLARGYIRKAMKLGAIAVAPGPPGKEYFDCLNEAEDLLAVASRISVSDDKELSYVYYKWAVVLAMRNDFRGAWGKVRLSRMHGNAVEQGFVDPLSRDMPEPREDD